MSITLYKVVFVLYKYEVYVIVLVKVKGNRSVQRNRFDKSNNRLRLRLSRMFLECNDLRLRLLDMLLS